MSGLADTLLLAAVSWRGKPERFAEGGLGAVGESFDAAWAASEFSLDVASSNLAFEYFTGLIFNAAYGDLADVVRTWLARERGAWAATFEHVTIPGQMWNWEVALRDLSAPPNTRFALSTGPTGPVQYTPTLYNWGSPELFGEYQETVTVLQKEEWGHAVVEPTDSENKVVVRIPWSRMFRAYPGYDIPEAVVLFGHASGWVFRGEIVEAVTAFIAGERAYPRQYVPPQFTAQALNGWVFANWAQGKFGSPVAQDVGA